MSTDTTLTVLFCGYFMDSPGDAGDAPAPALVSMSYIKGDKPPGSSGMGSSQSVS